MGRLAVLMVLSYLIQTYASNPGIADLPLVLYLKETLGLSAGALAKFQAIGFIPWTIKPLWGIIADSFPLFGYSTKSYLLVCYSSALFIFLGLSQIKMYTFSNLIVGYILISTCIAFSDVLADKLMVREGSPEQKTAILQAAQWTGAGFGGAIMYYLSGWIAKNLTLSAAFLISAIVPSLGLVATLLLLTEKKVEQGTVSIQRSMSRLWSTIKSQQFLAILGFIAFLGFSPAPPLLFYKRDVLRFEEEFLGTLGAVWSLAFGLGAIVFGIFAHKISHRILLNLIIALSAISTLALGFMFDVRSAILVDSFYGFTYAIATLGMFEIVVKVCSTNAEGTIYALLVSVSNFSASVGTIFGGWLYDNGVAFSILVVISALFTSLCWLLIPLFKLEGA